ncbi:hypothetical protein E4U35_001519 [Claviceps purpurea]|nr:hypothetical protein E4U35_001519 [Claviceps purpurea]KAG6274786.1 hypothetical protein E4U47_001352 [Claviceps purpurea]
MAPPTTIQLEGIQVASDCKSLQNVEAYKYYLMNFVKTKKAPLGTPLWPSNKWTVLMPGTRLCLWDVGGGVPCLHATTNRGNLGAHYKRHADECSPQLKPPQASPAASSPAGPSAPTNTGSASQTTPTCTRQYGGNQVKRYTAIGMRVQVYCSQYQSNSDAIKAYYEDMARKHQAAIKAGKSVKKQLGPPAGHFYQALMPMPMKADGSGLSKFAVQTLMKAFDPKAACANDACVKAHMCLQNASCLLWSKFEHAENDSIPENVNQQGRESSSISEVDLARRNTARRNTATRAPAGRPSAPRISSPLAGQGRTVRPTAESQSSVQSSPLAGFPPAPSQGRDNCNGRSLASRTLEQTQLALNEQLAEGQRLANEAEAQRQAHNQTIMALRHEFVKAQVERMRAGEIPFDQSMFQLL